MGSIRHALPLDFGILTAAQVEAHYPRNALAQKYTDTSGPGLPEYAGLDGKKYGWRTGGRILGRLIMPTGKPRGVVLVFHGAGGDSTYMTTGNFGTYPDQIAHRLDYALISVDTGIRSIGNPIALTCVDLAYDWQLSQPWGRKQVHLWGSSMGGLTATNWCYKNRDKVQGIIGFSPALDIERDDMRAGHTIPADWYPQPGDPDYGTEEDDAEQEALNRAAVSAAYGVRDAGLLGQWGWSGGGTHDAVAWQRDVVAEGYVAAGRHPEFFADVPFHIFRAESDHLWTYTRKWAEAAGGLVTFRDPGITNTGSGHTSNTWDTMNGSVPTGRTDQQIDARGGLSPGELAWRFAQNEVESAPDTDPEVWNIPDEYANTTGTDYVSTRLQEWLDEVPQGATIWGKQNATYLVDQSLEVIDRDLEFDWRGSEIYCPITDPVGVIPEGHPLYNPATPNKQFPWVDRNLVEIIGGKIKLRNLTVRQTNTVPGRFVVEREGQSAIKARGVESLLLDNVHTRDTWGDGFILAHDIRGGKGLTPSRNVTVLPNCTMKNSGRNGVAFVSCVDYDVSPSLIEHYGYMALDWEPNGATTRCVRGNVGNAVPLLITPPPAGGNVELGTISIGGGGERIEELDIWNVHMTRRSNTVRDVVEVTDGTPTKNVRIGWLTDDGTDDGRGCTFRTIHRAVDVKGTPGFRYVGNQVYGTNVSGSLQDEAFETRNGGDLMDDAIVEWNTFRGFKRVIADNNDRLDVERVRYNRLGEGLPFDQPPRDDLPLEVPFLAHVMNMTPGEVLAANNNYGAAGYFNYQPFTGQDIIGDLNYFRAQGMVEWIQAAPAPNSLDNLNKVQEILDYATEDELSKMIWCCGQEMQHKLDPDNGDYAQHLERQAALWDLVLPYGCWVGVHAEAYALNPNAGGSTWDNGHRAGATNFIRLLGDLADRPRAILASSCITFGNTNNGKAQMDPVYDIWRAECPDARLMFTSMAWSVPTGSALGSAARVTRANSAEFAFTYARDTLGATGFGWFDFGPDYDGHDFRIATDPLLLAVVQDFTGFV